MAAEASLSTEHRREKSSVSSQRTLALIISVFVTRSSRTQNVTF